MSRIPPKGAVLPPLEMSDRVDHTKFGLGTISAPPDGEKYEVIFDNSECGTKKIVRRFLSLVTRPDTKGAPYWAHVYAQILDKVQDSRWRTVVSMERAFDDPGDDPSDAKKIRELLERENADISALLAFLDADEAGEHH